MVIEIKKDSLEERILKVLIKKYPITISELQKDLNTSEKIINRTLKSLQAKNILALEPLPDKTYIHLLRFDLSFVGRKPTQRKAFKKELAKRKKKQLSEYDKIMYG